MSKYHTSPIEILSDIYDILAQNGAESVLDKVQTFETLNRIDHIDHEHGYIQFEDFKLQIVKE